MTDDGLVVAGGAGFQRLWRPMVNGETVDLAQTAPGQVIIGNTGAGLIVNEGQYGATDRTQGKPYLALISEDGHLTRLDPCQPTTSWKPASSGSPTRPRAPSEVKPRRPPTCRCNA